MNEKSGQTEHLKPKYTRYIKPDQSEHLIPGQTDQWKPKQTEQSKISDYCFKAVCQSHRLELKGEPLRKMEDSNQCSMI